ncbi:MAG: hypothetical protein KA354_17565 [Phycisphaerae bacterium]|nr:hypothetical protein [Phycisphaerae bacterium]
MNSYNRLVERWRWLSLFLGVAATAGCSAAPAEMKFTGGDLQAILDRAPKDAIVVCEQTEPIPVARTLRIERPMTLKGLKAVLPERLGDTILLSVEAGGVTLRDLELRGNYDTVDQKNRAPLIHVKAGPFRIERCRFFDASKDGVMITPDDGTGDIVGGVVREIEGIRMGRDVVSISGGNGGQRVRDVTVETVRLKTGFYRGAVEVSDGTDNITVRHVVAEDAVYALDVQDHGARQEGKPAPCAPNTNITAEDIEAVHCKHLIRTSNHPLGHAGLVLRNLRAKHCAEPVRISNTKEVRIQGLTIVNDPELKKTPILIRNCEDTEVRNVTITGLREGVEPILGQEMKNFRIDGIQRNK